jgi:ankyrin repeat protein
MDDYDPIKGFTELHYAATAGDAETVRRLIAAGNEVNAFDDGKTPLHYAVEKGHIEVAKTLIDAGANVNAHDPSVIGDTPLGLVAGDCSLEMAKLLIKSGADPTIRGWMHLCALDRAKDRKRGDGPAVYQLLLGVSKFLPPEHRCD